MRSGRATRWGRGLWYGGQPVGFGALGRVWVRRREASACGSPCVTRVGYMRDVDGASVKARDSAGAWASAWAALRMTTDGSRGARLCLGTQA